MAVHKSVLLRIRDKALGYAPPNLNSDFRQRVLALEELPETLTYERSIEVEISVYESAEQEERRG